MIKAYIKYKNENSSLIISKCNINSKIIDENYKIFKFEAVVYGIGNENIIYLTNYKSRYIKYIFNEKDFAFLKKKNYNIVPSNYKVGDIVMISKKIGEKHIVAPLENLEKISEKYKIPKEQIMASNKLKTEKLFIGQVLWI